MTTTPIDNLRENIRRVQARRKRIFTMRQLCLGLAAIVALFMALGLIEMAFQFPITGRIALFSILLIGAGALGIWFLHAGRQTRIDDRRIAHYVEDHIPELEQRLITSMESGDMEKKGWSPQLVERLWEDTGARVEGRSLLQVTPVRAVWSAAGTAVLMICLLVFTLWNWNDFSRAGKRVILPWTGTVVKIALPVKLNVAPGDVRIERGNDVMLIARIENAVPKKVDLFVQTDQVNWTRVPMTREGDENTYVHFLSSVKKDVLYYVDIGMKRSNHHRISVFDMPRDPNRIACHLQQDCRKGNASFRRRDGGRTRNGPGNGHRFLCPHERCDLYNTGHRLGAHGKRRSLRVLCSIYSGHPPGADKHQTRPGQSGYVP